MQVDDFEPITIRICPLLGGARHEALKSQIKSMLEQRGVPQDAQERISNIMAKIAVNKFNPIKDMQEKEAWMLLKKLATEAKVKMILPDELKQHQSSQRKNQECTVACHTGR